MSIKSVEESTVIGKSVTIRGELTASEDLYLDGELRGSAVLAQNRLTVGPNAQIFADLSVRDLVVLGHVEGTIRAAGRVDIRQSAVVQGDIFAARLSIEDKASMKGRVELTRPVAESATAQREAVAAAPGLAGALLFEQAKH